MHARTHARTYTRTEHTHTHIHECMNARTHTRTHTQKLYTGDGYTRSDDGTRGPAEFLCRNLEISQIAGAAVIDVQVDL